MGGLTQHMLDFLFSPKPPSHVTNPESRSSEELHDIEMHELMGDMIFLIHKAT